MHYLNLMFRGVEAIRAGFNTYNLVRATREQNL